MRKTKVALISAPLILASYQACSAELPSFMFDDGDWELICDNTHTCRAAGYYSGGDEESLPVSVQLVRQAGPRQPVTAQLHIGHFEVDGRPAKLSRSGVMKMTIDGRPAGTVTVDSKTMKGKLSTGQVNVVVAALAKDSTLEWTKAGTKWRVSSSGADAVLTKMDEFQGRAGTLGALLRKGNKTEDSVLPALPMPIVVAAPVPAWTAEDEPILSSINQESLLSQLRATLKEGEDFCDGLDDLGKSGSGSELSAYRLAQDKLLVSARCYQGPYNSGYGYWVLNSTPPHSPALVTTTGSSYDKGTISFSHKGRGLGGCFYVEEWTWDGRQFVHTLSLSTGRSCEISLDGAWEMPSLVTKVVKDAVK